VPHCAANELDSVRIGLVLLVEHDLPLSFKVAPSIVCTAKTRHSDHHHDYRNRPFHGSPLRWPPRILTRDDRRLNTVRWCVALSLALNGNKTGHRLTAISRLAATSAAFSIAAAAGFHWALK
jgi:hypothetical protein